MISEAQIRALAAYHGEPVVTTVYLDVDGRHRPIRATLPAVFEGVTTELTDRLADGDRSVYRAVSADLDRMREWLGRDWERSTTRGLAMFACSAEDWFQVVPLAFPVADTAGIGPHPRIAPLLAALDAHQRFMVALVDRRRVRILHVELGEANEAAALTEPEERAVDTGAEQEQLESHAEEAARAHWRRAAAHVERALAEWPTAQLVLGGPDEAVAGLSGCLPASVRATVAGRVSVAVAAPVGDVVTAAAAVITAVEQAREAATVAELRQRAETGRGAVIGLDATLAALEEKRVETLVVAEGFTSPGGQCPSCGHLGPDVGRCPRCGSDNVAVDDIVEIAVDEAAAQHSAIEFCRDGELDEVGKIGALQRF